MSLSKVQALLGNKADSLLGHNCNTIPKESLHLPGPDFIERVWEGSNRSPQVLRSLGDLHNHGRLAGTGYMSIFFDTVT